MTQVKVRFTAITQVKVRFAAMTQRTVRFINITQVKVRSIAATQVKVRSNAMTHVTFDMFEEIKGEAGNSLTYFTLCPFVTPVPKRWGPNGEEECGAIPNAILSPPE